MEHCDAARSNAKSIDTSRTIWPGVNDLNGTVEARFTAERVPEMNLLGITGAVLAVYFLLYVWGRRMQRAEQHARALCRPVVSGPGSSSGIDRGWRWFSHAVSIATTFVVVSAGIFIITQAVGMDFGSRDDHPILKHQWYIIVAVCLA